ncbi:MAG TPA: hypothetical protein VMT60_04075 [Candidatus Bathyarchaeia archaeon]|nr:hypothetical protein [Candidatus Bathyarchaeia archaeon]
MVARILTRVVIAALLCAALCAPLTAAGEDVLKGYQVLPSPDGSFVVLYPPHLERMAREIEKLIDESAGAIAGELGLEHIGTIRVILASDTRTYGILHQGRVPEWGIAFSNLQDQVLGINVDLVVRNRRPYVTVVRHELSHLLLAQRVENASVPTWFMEGLAMRQSGEWNLSDAWRLMTMAPRRNIPYLEELRGPFPRSSEDAAMCYAISYFAVEELLLDRPGALMTLTAFIRDTRDFEGAFASTFGMSTYEFAGKVYVEFDRRYKVPGTILNAAPYWIALALLFVAVYLVKRVRTRRTIARWEEQEARERRVLY